MRIASHQNPPAQALQRRMPHDALHEPLTQPAPAIRLQHKHVAKISEGCEIADDARKSDLPGFSVGLIINAEAQRMLDRPGHNVAWNVLSPVAIRQEPVN